MLLLIIGTSSSGKTTLARALQTSLPGYWHYMGLDVFFAGMPDQYGGGNNGPLSQAGFRYENKETDARIAYGDVGRCVLQGMVSSAVAFHDAGVNLIFDDMILDEGHAELWQGALAGVDSTIVHLSAPQEVLQSRNTARDNPPGLATNHIDPNELISPDVSFDTGVTSTEECVKAIAERLANKALNRTC